MKTNEIPTNIGEYLKYDETSPTCLRWTKKFCDKINVGNIAGSLGEEGYYRTGFDKKQYFNHRIVFFLHHGSCPEYIDHIDNNPLNNKIDNLRESTISENGFNRKISKNNTSGHKGVCKHKKHNTVYWRVSIIKNKKSYQRIFPIDKFQEACDYADALRKTLHGYFSNDGSVK